MPEKEFEEFYNLHKKRLWLFVQRVTNDSDLSDDIVQDSFIKFLAKSNSLNNTSYKSYLYKIACNKLNDHFRSVKRQTWYYDILKKLTDKFVNHKSNLLDSYESIFEQLNIQEKTLIYLAYIEHYSHKEIAEIIKSHEKSIKVLLHRCKKKLEVILKNDKISLEDL